MTCQAFRGTRGEFPGQDFHPLLVEYGVSLSQGNPRQQHRGVMFPCPQMKLFTTASSKEKYCVFKFQIKPRKSEIFFSPPLKKIIIFLSNRQKKARTHFELSGNCADSAKPCFNPIPFHTSFKAWRKAFQSHQINKFRARAESPKEMLSHAPSLLAGQHDQHSICFPSACNNGSGRVWAAPKLPRSSAMLWGQILLSSPIPLRWEEA